LGNTIVSRIDVSPASSITILSNPKTIPPCGGALYLNNFFSCDLFKIIGVLFSIKFDFVP
jgi:hypothetical protein